jgi:protein involved in temperature-dependent protein secretion
VRTYRRGNCEQSHRTYRTLARCMFPRTAWIAGEEGPIALLAWCQVLTVTLHHNIDGAAAAKSIIDYSACGGRCTGRHEIVQLDRGDS